MTAHSLIAIGASAGGIEALRTLLPRLSPTLPAAVAVVVHRQPVEENQRLARVLQTGSRLPVVTAEDGMTIAPGRVYVSPAAVHLVVERERFRLNTGPKENGTRPAIDVLFRSAATTYGRRAAGVVLSGLLDDGTAGLATIKAHGGYALAQDPAEAVYGDMPRSAIEQVHVDAVDTAVALAALLDAFALRAEGLPLEPVRESKETTSPSLFSCPDCGGVLSAVESDGAQRFRCRTGHAYGPATLFDEQEGSLETALWVALRALVEREDMSARLAERSSVRGFDAAARRFQRQAELARERAEIVRSALGGSELARSAAQAIEQ